MAATKKAARPSHGLVFNTTREAVVDEQVKVLREYSSSKAIEDPYKNYYGTVGGQSSISIHEPPYNLAALVRLPDENNTLRQCIAAMTTNVVGHGYRLEYIGPGKADDEVAKKEKANIEAMIERPNADMTFAEFCRRIWDDYETTGNGYIEVGKDNQQRVTMLNHVVSESMRLTMRDTEQTQIEVTLPRDGKDTVIKTKKRFRRIVQMVGTKRVFFKELGDPRNIDPDTGAENTALDIEDSATEVFHLCNYNPRSPYGLPRWIGQLPSVLGSRQAELTNLDFFSENAIPAMAILVSGGVVTQETLDMLETTVLAARGRQAANRVLTIEVQGDPANAAENGQIPAPKIELKPLTGERMNEGQFLEYLAECIDLIRSSFRLPPLFIGRSEDMTHATAKTSYAVAESQVFSPERQRFDDFMNNVVLSSWGIKNWRYKSHGPALTSAEDVIAGLETLEKLGALTPNIAIGVANELFELEVKPVEAEWGNWPFSVVMELAKKGELVGMEKITMDAGTREKLRPTPEVLDPASGKAVQPGAKPGAGKAKPKVDEKAKAEPILDALISLKEALDTPVSEEHVHVTV